MSWLFSQALVEEYSADTCLAGEPCAQLSVMPTLHKFWRNDKTIDASDHSRFGLTSQVLTDVLGEELLTSYLADFHARISASRALAPGLVGREVDYGLNSSALFATWNQNSSTWKTAQHSLFEDLELSLVTWPKWGSMLNGVSYQRQTPVLNICAKESGLWPTPTVHGNNNQPGMSKNAGWGLSSAVKQWPTPTASLGKNGGRITPRKGREGGTLIEDVSARMFPTPCARDRRTANTKPYSERGGGKKGEQLNNAARHWPTPTVGGSRAGGTLQEWGGSKNWVRQEDLTLARGQLNPAWVEWLMGWPIGWTELKPLEMDKFHEWQLQHGGF